jgi:indole-3-glycerol phosphate synthase
MSPLNGTPLDLRRAWIARKRRENVEGVFRAVALQLPLPPSFFDAVRVPRAPRAIIAELKRVSPEAGGTSYSVEVPSMIRELEACGVSAFAVRTDEDSYGTGYTDLLAAAQTTALPILCRDLILDPVQIVMARAHGAAAVTLDASLVGERELRALHRQAVELGLDVVLEVHSAADVDHALRVFGGDESAMRLMGVDGSARDGSILDIRAYERLGERLPQVAFPIATAAIDDPAHIEMLEKAGYEAFVVSDPLLRANCRHELLAELAGSTIA